MLKCNMRSNSVILCSLRFSVFYLLITKAVCNIYTAQTELETLHSLQKKVQLTLENYLVNEKLRLNKIQSIIKHTFERKPSSELAYGDHMGLNPLNAFVSIKSLTSDLDHLVNLINEDFNYKELANSLTEMKKMHKFPRVDDLSGAAIALIRLQDTYLLDTSALSSGNINELCCASKLTVDDCFEIGRQSYNVKNYPRTIEWMNEALMKIQESENNTLTGRSDDIATSYISTVTKIQITDYIQLAERILGIISQAQEFMSKAVGVEFNTLVNKVVSQIRDDAEYKDDDFNDTVEEYALVKSKYESLCRGEINSNGTENSLRCSYHVQDYYFLLAPVKQEMINEDPQIVIYHQVLQDPEIEIIKQLAEPIFDEATVLNNAGGSEKSDVRVSKSAWLSNKDHNLVKRIQDRIGFITGLSMETSEDLQIANYGLGGHYEPHFDFAFGNQYDHLMTEKEGNRIATALLYLSNVEAGGATVFTKLELSVRPIKGSVLVWYNLLDNGKGDARTKHAACPVLLGSKWVANKWIHERGQEFIVPCKRK